MCNFDGMFRWIKEMSIAGNLYINVVGVLVSIITLLASFVTLMNFLTDNFSYKDLINLVDNMEYSEIDMYIQVTDQALVNYFDNYGLIYKLYNSLYEIYNAEPYYFLNDELTSKYLDKFLVAENNVNKIQFDDPYIAEKLNLMGNYPMYYRKYGSNNDDESINKVKKILKHLYLIFHIIRDMKFFEYGPESSLNQIRYLDKFFIDNKSIQYYFYYNNLAENFFFDPKSKDKSEIIVEKLVENLGNIYKTKNYLSFKNDNLSEALMKYPIIFDRKTEIMNITQSSNYIPQFIYLYNKYDNTKIREILNNISIEDLFIDEKNVNRENIRNFYYNSTENFFMFSNLNFFNLFSFEIFSHSRNSNFPLFITADENMEIITKDYCILLRNFLKLKNSTTDPLYDYSKNFYQCLYNDNSIDNQFSFLFKQIKNLNKRTYFNFCDIERNLEIEEEEQENNNSTDSASQTKEICLNRFSEKRRFENPENKTSFKFKSSISPLLSYKNLLSKKLSFSNFYFTIFLKNEAYKTAFQHERYNNIITNSIRGLFVYIVIWIILITLLACNLFRVKAFIDRPLDIIKKSLHQISDKLKFKEYKKNLDEYIVDADSNTINEFKYLIKMILKLVEGNLSIKKNQNKSNELNDLQINNIIHPINMVKFNKYVLFEKKIMESIDNNQYCTELVAKASNEIKSDSKLETSNIFKNIILNKFLREKTDKNTTENFQTKVFSEEKFRTKFKFPSFEKFYIKNVNGLRKSKSTHKFISNDIKSNQDNKSCISNKNFNNLNSNPNDLNPMKKKEFEKVKNKNLHEKEFENEEENDIYNIDLLELDKLIDHFKLDIQNKYMEDWYKNTEKNELLFNCYDDIFNK